jgi:hypothetical protein
MQGFEEGRNAGALRSPNGGEGLVSEYSFRGGNQRRKRGVSPSSPSFDVLLAIEAIEVPERLWEAVRPNNADAIFHDANPRTVGIHKDRVYWKIVTLGVVILEICRIGLDLIEVSRSHAATLELEHDEPVRGEHHHVRSTTALAR